MKIAAGKFKAQCLKLMDEVEKHHTEIIITKYGKPVARLVPVGEQPVRPVFGLLKDSVSVYGDIVEPVGDTWEADGHNE
ncbi:MAG: type II toxin-antitoxin system prevent-host-death family antitoxin [bacterium]|nr:type II toxin-antitoxin system prevent-host-death family antitoxin [bacterium]